MKIRWIMPLLVLGFLSVTALAQMGGSDEETASSTWKLINDQSYAFTWHYEPGSPPGFYKGSPPHGKVLRTFYNNIAFDATQTRSGTFPLGSVLVKENHLSQRKLSESKGVIKNFTPNLKSVTVMVKMPSGYNPKAGDWFWAKYQPDGTVVVAGKVESCAACHAQRAKNDYVFDAQLTASQ